MPLTRNTEGHIKTWNTGIPFRCVCSSDGSSQNSRTRNWLRNNTEWAEGSPARAPKRSLNPERWFVKENGKWRSLVKNPRKLTGDEMKDSRAQRKERRQEEAEERQSAWDGLNTAQQLQKLDERLGMGVGAKKQRARLMNNLLKKDKGE